MNIEQLIDGLLADTINRSIGHFLPELALCVTIVLLLLVRLVNIDRLVPTYVVALLGALVGFGFAWSQFMEIKGSDAVISDVFFTGLLVYDSFTVFFRLFLLLFLILVIALTVLSGIPDAEDGPDFYSLLLGSTIGMMLMASANHLLILFLGIEMTSVPSYAMVGFLKGRKFSSEAALKYVVYGAGAAGVMLYGISLIAGLLGTGDLPQLAGQMQLLVAGSSEVGLSSAEVRTVLLGIMLVLVGLAFKLSIVPFHFWCPDAFEGASAEVAGFLSVASKAGAFALLVRFCLAFANGDPGSLQPVYLSLGIGLGVVAAITATFGNLAAYSQTNIKRLLAYSTIAHAGYMLMAVASLMVLVNAPADAGLSSVKVAELGSQAMEGLLYYLAVYLFMNLGAFAIVALIRNHTFSEEIAGYKGLIHETPVLCVCMLVCMFSLIGLPPFGGFVAKFMIFYSLFEAGHVHWSMWVILCLAGLNTVFSLFYYLNVLRVMFIEDRPEGARRVNVPFGSISASYALMLSIPVLLLGVWPGLTAGLSATARDVASVLMR